MLADLRTHHGSPKAGPDLRGLRLAFGKLLSLSFLQSEGRPRFEGIEMARLSQSSLEKTSSEGRPRFEGIEICRQDRVDAKTSRKVRRQAPI